MAWRKARLRRVAGALELGRLLEGVIVGEEAHVDDVERLVAGVGDALDHVAGIAVTVGVADLDRDQRDARGDADDAVAVRLGADDAGDVRAVEVVVDAGERVANARALAGEVRAAGAVDVRASVGAQEVKVVAVDAGVDDADANLLPAGLRWRAPAARGSASSTTAAISSGSPPVALTAFDCTTFNAPLATAWA